jgi:hypothetical protein
LAFTFIEVILINCNQPLNKINITVMATINKNLSVYDSLPKRFRFGCGEWNEGITEGLYNGS